jgi:hypothetical protein
MQIGCCKPNHEIDRNCIRVEIILRRISLDVYHIENHYKQKLCTIEYDVLRYVRTGKNQLISLLSSSNVGFLFGGRYERNRLCPTTIS